MQRHSRHHHRVTHRRWMRRRQQLLLRFWGWYGDNPRFYDTHMSVRLYGRVKKWDRRYEWKAYRRRARIAYSQAMDPPPFKRNTWL